MRKYNVRLHEQVVDPRVMSERKRARVDGDEVVDAKAAAAEAAAKQMQERVAARAAQLQKAGAALRAAKRAEEQDKLVRESAKRAEEEQKRRAEEQARHRRAVAEAVARKAEEDVRRKAANAAEAERKAAVAEEARRKATFAAEQSKRRATFAADEAKRVMMSAADAQRLQELAASQQQILPPAHRTTDILLVRLADVSARARASLDAVAAKLFRDLTHLNTVQRALTPSALKSQFETIGKEYEVASGTIQARLRDELQALGLDLDRDLTLPPQTKLEVQGNMQLAYETLTRDIASRMAELQVHHHQLKVAESNGGAGAGAGGHVAPDRVLESAFESALQDLTAVADATRARFEDVLAHLRRGFTVLENNKRLGHDVTAALNANTQAFVRVCAEIKTAARAAIQDRRVMLERLISQAIAADPTSSALKKVVESGQDMLNNVSDFLTGVEDAMSAEEAKARVESERLRGGSTDMLAKLQAQNVDLTSKLVAQMSLQAHNGELLKQKEKADAQHALLKHQFQQAQAAVTELQATIDSLERAAVVYENERKAHEAEIAELRTQITTDGDAVHKLRETIDGMTAERDANLAKIDALRAQVDDAQETLAKRTEEAKFAARGQSVAASSVGLMQMRLEDLQDFKINAEMRLKIAEDELQAANSFIDSKQRFIQTLLAHTDMLTFLLQEKTKSFQALEQNARQAPAVLAAQRASLSETRSTLEHLGGAGPEPDAMDASLQARLTALRTGVRTQAEQLSYSAAQFAALRLAVVPGKAPPVKCMSANEVDLMLLRKTAPFVFAGDVQVHSFLQPKPVDLSEPNFTSQLQVDATTFWVKLQCVVTPAFYAYTKSQIYRCIECLENAAEGMSKDVVGDAVESACICAQKAPESQKPTDVHVFLFPAVWNAHETDRLAGRPQNPVHVKAANMVLTLRDAIQDTRCGQLDLMWATLIKYDNGNEERPRVAQFRQLVETPALK